MVSRSGSPDDQDDLETPSGGNRIRLRRSVDRTLGEGEGLTVFLKVDYKVVLLVVVVFDILHFSINELFRGLT